MKSQLKFLVIALVSLFALMGSVFADPINVVDLDVQEANGEMIILVSLQNDNVSTGTTSDLTFSIQELSTSENVGVVKIDTTDVVVKQYNLEDVTDSFDSLKKGETYQLTVETDSGSSQTQAFLFGTERTTSGLELIVEDIEINRQDVTSLDTLQVVNGETLNVEIRFTALEDFDDAVISAKITGYEHSTLYAETEIFAARQGVTYVKTMTLNLPSDMESEKQYKLRISGSNDLSDLTYKDMELYVDTQRHRIDVLDLVMTPSSGVEPGQNIIANVRMENRGQKSQDSTKVTVEIENLNVMESSYVSNLAPQEDVTSDDMLLFIPEDAAPGQYDVKVILTYNDGYTQTLDSYTLNILSPKLVEEENLLVSFKNNIDLKAGESNTFEIVIANPNEDSKPISIAVKDNVWADVEVSPTLAMVQGGVSETFQVTVTPKSAIAGENDLALTIKEGSNTVSQLTVKTYVEPSEEIDWVNVALAILLIIAIIILLALVITIAKRRNEGNEEDDMSSTEEYY